MNPPANHRRGEARLGRPSRTATCDQVLADTCGGAVLPTADAGSASVEVVLLAPLLVALLFFVVVCGRIAQAGIQLADATHQAARAASMTWTPEAATLAATQVAQAALQPGSAGCTAPAVDVDTSAFQSGGSVTVTITCTVPLADLTGLALPATKSFTDSFTVPIDAYRSAAAPAALAAQPAPILTALTAASPATGRQQA